jgi:hypothetical protein
VYVVRLLAEVPVPEMFPLTGLKASPAGSEGEIDQVVAGDPVFRGAIVVAATSL